MKGQCCRSRRFRTARGFSWISCLHFFGSRDVSAVAGFFGVGEGRGAARGLRRGARGAVSGILERQNRGWGASAKTLANVERLRRGALAAVTGQQVGLFGGPLFRFQGADGSQLAGTGTRGSGVRSGFRLATEDHDLAEVNHVALLSERGLPERLAVEIVRLKVMP